MYLFDTSALLFQQKSIPQLSTPARIAGIMGHGVSKVILYGVGCIAWMDGISTLMGANAKAYDTMNMKAGECTLIR